MTTLTRGAVTERPGRPHYQHERALMLMPSPKLAEVFLTAAGSSSISPTTSSLRSRDVLLIPLRPSRLPELTRLEDYHRQVSDDHLQHRGVRAGPSSERKAIAPVYHRCVRRELVGAVTFGRDARG